jgi:hypothetical protein
MNDFSNDYENLKNQLNDDKGKLIGYLFVGLIIGRLYEKIIVIVVSVGMLLTTVASFLAFL